MTFFKKKRLGDVEGYDRISRLIDDRHRELSEGEAGADDLEEDTVLLSPQLRSAQQALPREPSPDADAESAAIRRTPPVGAPVETFAPPQQAQPQAYAPPAAQAFMPSPTAPPTPRIPAPDLSAATGAVVSLVAKEAVWDGRLTSTGDVRIEGRLEGEVQTTGTLYVAAEARVQGLVKARSVILAGEIEGQLRCEERLEILPGGSAHGDIDTGTLVVHEGAFIESKFQMHREATPTPAGT